MSLQVGSFCYASAVEAGRAACSQYQPLSTILGDTIKTVSCSSADAVTGDLQLDVVTTTISTGISTFLTVSQALSYPPCIHQDYLDYIEYAFGGLFAVYIIWLCGWKMLSFLGWSRGENV